MASDLSTFGLRTANRSGVRKLFDLIFLTYKKINDIECMYRENIQ